jgi:hypothetical protein
MSESTSAPPPAPAAPAPSDGGSPPANTQPQISISEAARLLSRQRRGSEAPSAPERKPSAVEAARAAPQAEPPAPKPEPSPLSAMEKALGVPGTAPADAAPAVSDMALGDGVEIEGQRLKTLAEVRDFARRKSADYTTKTQELSQQRQALEAQQRALAEVLPYIQPELQRLQEIVQRQATRPDPALLDTDPNQYNRERAAYEMAVEEQNRLAGLTTLQQQAQQRAMEQAVNAANEQLAAKYSFWADPVERQAAQQQIVEWATTRGGFSRDELRGLHSPHHLEVMLKASLFDKWVESAKTAAPKQIAPVRGQAPPPAPSERVAVAEEAFGRKPDFRTAAALLSARRAGR